MPGYTGIDIVPEALIDLGLAARGQSDHEQATVFFREALEVSQELGTKPSVVNVLEGMVDPSGAVGEAGRAARLWGVAETWREDVGVVLPPGGRALHEPYLAAACSRLGEETWEEAVA